MINGFTIYQIPKNSHLIHNTKPNQTNEPNFIRTEFSSVRRQLRQITNAFEYMQLFEIRFSKCEYFLLEF